MPDEQWENVMLEDLARVTVFPPAPDLRSAVLSRLGEGRPESRRIGSLALVGVAAILIACALTFAVSREARDAVAGFLGLAVEGERIEVGPTPVAGALATPLPSEVPIEQLGENVSREGAVRLAGFEPRLPASLGEPAGYYVISQNRAVFVADYGQVQVWEFPLESASIGKMVFVSGGTIVSEQPVNGVPGYWISGGERVVTVSNAAGTPIASTKRTTTGNALVWADGGLYRRIEGVATLGEALRLAAEMR